MKTQDYKESAKKLNDFSSYVQMKRASNFDQRIFGYSSEGIAHIATLFLIDNWQEIKSIYS